MRAHGREHADALIAAEFDQAMALQQGDGPDRDRPSGVEQMGHDIDADRGRGTPMRRWAFCDNGFTIA
ncbi:MAG: hypothetical protein IPH03_08090 [Tetrasphaera sp.]|nr:hypothetical protein [Tetrasphaera sp.]